MNQILTSRVLVVFLFISTFIVQAQVSFDIKVSKKRLGLNERLRVDFVMNENGDNFNPPSFKGFQVVSGPQQAVSRSWVNGMQSFSKTYTYFLTPKLKGKIMVKCKIIKKNKNDTNERHLLLPHKKKDHDNFLKEIKVDSLRPLYNLPSRQYPISLVCPFCVARSFSTDHISF